MASFTPTSPINMSNEKDWAANLGMLDWDSTNIVFTKRTLIEFLKYTGTTVDTNFANIQKLPKYAKFGKIEGTGGSSPSSTVPSGNAATTTISASASAAEEWKPTRRVRELPGGARTNIFADEDVEDALSLAPPRPGDDETETGGETKDQANPLPPTGIKPSRRVREAPGGNSSLGNIWGGDEDVEEFKPTRRVRQPQGVALRA
ncbi:unnamed protein product [Mycena citricolor]|uniref:Uncharacterized protein n=1 Tax=Mycena citricolor TaxID=2018698 RepID=A0AAD2HRN7_9AGAR|nr:unnamed protein product [Mycena citricolor]